MQRDRIQKRIYHVLAAFVVVLGVTVTVVSIGRGDAVAACIGFAIILGAVAVVVLFRALDRLNRSVEALVEVESRRSKAEGRITEEGRERDTLSPEGTFSNAVVDLAAVGHGDPARIIAATLDRSVFPRLAETLNEQPPATTGVSRRLKPAAREEPGEDSAATATRKRAQNRKRDQNRRQVQDESDVDGVAHKNVLRIWKQAVRAGDLITCRSVYSILVDTVDPRLVARLQVQMQALADRTEQRLRTQFAQRVRQRDVEGVLHVGNQMCELLPDRPIAEEFRRLKPLLLFNLGQTASRPSGSNHAPQTG